MRAAPSTSRASSVAATPAPQQSAEFLAGIDPNGLRDAMVDELHAYFSFQVLDQQASYAALLTDRSALVESPALAQVYGVSTSDAFSELEPARAGLLTRAALLAGQGEETRPIQRGARIIRKLLCDPIAAPNPNDFPPNTIVPPPFDPEKSARQRWTEQTAAPNCNVCHSRINPFGFALEGSTPTTRRTCPRSPS